MGSRHWFSMIIKRKKGKDGKSRQPTEAPAAGKPSGSTSNNSSQEDVLNLTNDAACQGISDTNSTVVEDLAATCIQTAYRAYKARKTLQRMKGAKKLQMQLTEGQAGEKQCISTLAHLHTWGRIQFQIRERRLYMVMEGRLKQKKLENQQKLEAKLHDLEVEWCNGSETMEDILARIHQREEAAVKRERALAYAFSHQWRANSVQTQGLNASDLGRANWGWSWKERWIAARPWESRLALPSTNKKKGQNKQAIKANKHSNNNALRSEKSFTHAAKPGLPTCGKEWGKERRSSFPGALKPSGSEADARTRQGGSAKKGIIGSLARE